MPIIAGAVSKGGETRVSKIRTRVATQNFRAYSDKNSEIKNSQNKKYSCHICTKLLFSQLSFLYYVIYTYPPNKVMYQGVGRIVGIFTHTSTGSQR